MKDKISRRAEEKSDVTVDLSREISEAIKAGEKEQSAYERFGRGKMSRHEFQSLWIEIRHPKKPSGS